MNNFVVQAYGKNNAPFYSLMKKILIFFLALNITACVSNNDIEDDDEESEKPALIEVNEKMQVLYWVSFLFKT
ncbi:hypothetical protein C9J01_05820 [Photobacterium rosenbergii]|uniref:Uncharacterized protein n=1 Tax=Photobacterium rosenbergii TaxID=294936 RepID=A0A2T3NLX4_9GAMM|nr:hypothetical protein C9J01_05820 [Photobacterium rosenbergii]